MKGLKSIILIVLVLFGQILFAQKGYYPAPIGFVNDFERDFTLTQIAILDSSVKSLLAETMDNHRLQGIEMAVVTATDSMLGSETNISNYATQIGDKWGVGSKGENKAIIIIYSKSARKVAIVTGKALDAVLPPEICNRIVDEKMAPEFKKGHYFEAILHAITGLKEQLGLQ